MWYANPVGGVPFMDNCSPGETSVLESANISAGRTGGCGQFLSVVTQGEWWGSRDGWEDAS